jgi:hypothetical protein
VPIIAVAMEGWIAGLRARPMLQAVVLGGITIAGLGIIDVEGLAPPPPDCRANSRVTAVIVMLSFSAQHLV